MGRIGIQQLLIILVLALIIFGGGKLAGVGKALGTSIKDFKNEMADGKAEKKEAAAEEKAADATVVAETDEKTGGGSDAR